MRVDFQVVAVREGDGRVLPLSVKQGDAEGQSQLHKLDGEAREQFNCARALAVDTLSHPLFAKLRKHDVSGSTIQLLLPPGERIAGPSAGLSFYLAIMSLGIECPLRQDRVFSAKLNCSTILDIEHLPFVKIGEIGGGVSKVNAANQHGLARFWIAAGERELIDANERYLRGDPQQSLLPIRLDGDQIHCVPSLLLMGLDISKLLSSAEDTDTISLLQLVLNGMLIYAGEPGDVVPQGFFELIDKMRRTLSPSVFGGADGWSQYWNSIQGAILSLAERESEHGLKLRLFNAAIATTHSEHALSDSDSATTNQLNALLFSWSNEPDLSQLQWVLRVLHTLGSIVDPEAPAVSEYGEDLSSGFKKLLARHTIDQTQLSTDMLKRSLEFGKKLINELILSRIAAIDSTFVQACRPAMFEYLQPLDYLAYSNQVEPEVARFIMQLSSSIRQQIKFFDLSDEHHLMRSDSKQVLSLTFSACPGNAREREYDQTLDATAEDMYQNGLVLDVQAPDQIKFRVRGPALLFEPYQPDPRPTSLSSARIVPAHQILSHVDHEHALAASSRFGDTAHPNRIAYRFRDGREAEVRWSGLGWPPAIDSILLANAIEDDSLELEPARLIDVGSGTAFLAMVAATKWPSIQHIDLIDLDINAAISGQINMAQAGWGDVAITGTDQPTGTIHTHRTDFESWRGTPGDVLVVNPPYLPNRPIPLAGIQLATNNTRMLTDVVRRAPELVRYVYLVCSSIAWPELQESLWRNRSRYKGVTLLNRTLVRFRIPWLEYTEQSNPGYAQRVERYFQQTLRPRGVLDFDQLQEPDSATSKHINDLNHQDVKLPIPVLNSREHLDELQQAVVDQVESLRHSSRGVRYWHEIRCVRLDIA